jgi:hypothetical protein
MKTVSIPVSEEVARAARNLVSAHGKNAARIAAQRALNAELSGSGAAAAQWQQIARAIESLQIG